MSCADHSSRFVFGPVPSRRLGRSLGVDVVPFKTCTYDCVYCQLGRTTHKTCEQRMFFAAEEILGELEEKLAQISAPDFITLSGSGEPTLYKGLGSLIRGIKRITDIKLAVLTNGSLLYREDVRNSIMEADLVIPSLDAGDNKTFQKINRPHASIGFEEMVRGLSALRREFHGDYWLEVFMVNNITTTQEQIHRIKDLIEYIKPDRVQLNTAVRCTAEEYVEAVSTEEMEEICAVLGHDAEIISHGSKEPEETCYKVGPDDIMSLLLRRPCTIDDIASGLNMHRNEAIKHVTALREKDLITIKRLKDTVLYVARHA